MSLSGKTVLITGASRGFGLAIAKAMLRAGATVIGWGRDPAALEAAKAELEAIGGDFTFDTVDVTDEPVVVERMAALPGLDVLVNNAGIARSSPFLETPTQELRDTLEVNLIGAFVVLREGARRMIDLGNGGAVINIASDAAVMGIATMGPYCASKHGLLGLGRSAQLALHEHGVRVSNFCPGPIATNIMHPDGSENPGAMDADDLALSVVHLAAMSPRLEIQELLVRPFAT
jgi:NAD(P)-dependent dehydrogenase (short-subunit alcohol dehydrogenase family)